MKVLYLLLGSASEEPQAESQFIAGYESNGATWNGTFTILENVQPYEITNEFLQGYINQGYEMYIRNYVPDLSKLEVYKYARERGMLFVSPVGSNQPLNSQAFVNNYAIVTTGAGKRKYGNATGYPGFFFDEDPIEGAGTNIADIRQCGTVYNIASVERFSSTRLAFKLTGVSNASSIGLHVTGTRIFLKAITGTDISPLPVGYYFTVAVDGDKFYVDFATTSGTIGGFQTATGGTMTYGDLSGTYALVRLQDTITAFNSYGVTLEGITGFSNNVPDGINQIQQFITGIGYWNSFTILHNLGSGAYEGNGRGYMITQSYSSVFIGGQLAYMKDTLNRPWHRVLGRAIKTASEYPNFHSRNGYGYINVTGAIDSLLDTDRVIGLETPVLNPITVNSPGVVTLTWNLIPFAKSYEIYYHNELIETVTAHITTKQVTVQRQPKGTVNYFKVRAVNTIGESNFSNEIEYPYYYYAGITVKSYT